MTAGTRLTSPEVEGTQLFLLKESKAIDDKSECFYLSKIRAWNKTLPLHADREMQYPGELSAGSDLQRKEPCPGLSLAQFPIFHNACCPQDSTRTQPHLKREPGKGHP